MAHEYPGKLILFEGPEGAGKSTQIKMLAIFLEKIGLNVVTTREPGHATPMGVKIREMLMDPALPMSHKEELALFIRGRANHFDKIVIPALKAGKIILCDRSSPSTIAYQHYGRGLNLTDILVQDAQARRNIDFDLILLLDLDPEVGLARKKPETRFELEAIEFHKKVRNGYLEQAKNNPDGKWRVIDAAQSPGAVCLKAWEEIRAVQAKKKIRRGRR